MAAPIPFPAARTAKSNGCTVSHLHNFGRDAAEIAKRNAESASNSHSSRRARTANGLPDTPRDACAGSQYPSEAGVFSEMACSGLGGQFLDRGGGGLLRQLPGRAGNLESVAANLPSEFSNLELVHLELERT